MYVYIDILFYLPRRQPLFREQVRLNGAVAMDFGKKKIVFNAAAADLFLCYV